MTVATTERKQSFTTNGVTVDFPFTFKATDANQIYCQYTPSGGSTIDYTNFTVVLQEAGGTVTTNDVLGSGTLLVYRIVPLTQNTDYVEGGRFPAESHEAALDKLTLIDQDQQEDISRALKGPIGKDNPYTLAETLAEDELLIMQTNEIKSSGTTIGDLNNAIDNANNAAQNAEKVLINLPSGQWAAGITFNSANEFMNFNGVGYTPLPTTTFPYVTQGNDPTQAPDNAFVQPFSNVNSSSISTYTDLVFDSVAEAIQAVTDGTAPLTSKLRVEDYYGGASPNNSGVLFFEVVNAGTGTADGGRYIDAGSFQLRQNIGDDINVKKWGAIPNASSPTTSHIQAAIDYAESLASSGATRGGIVHIPSGLYLVDATLRITTSRVSIRGDNRYNTTLVRNSDYGDTIFIGTGTGALLEECGVSGLLINADVNGSVMTSGAHVRIQAVTHSTVSDFDLSRGFIGVLIEGCVDVTLNNGSISGAAIPDNSLRAGILLNGLASAATPLPTQIGIMDVQSFGRAYGYAMVINASEQVNIDGKSYFGNAWFHNVDINQTTDNFPILNVTFGPAVYIDGTLEESTFDGNSVNITGAQGDGSADINGVTFSGTTIRGQGADSRHLISVDGTPRGGVYDQALGKLNVIGCDLLGSDNSAINLLGGRLININGCNISGSNEAGTYTNVSCIEVGSNCDNVLINGNYIGGSPRGIGAGNSSYGIRVQNGATKVSLTNNVVGDNAISGILDNSANAATGNRKLISNNNGYNPGIVAVPVQTSGVDLVNPTGHNCFVSIFGGTVSKVFLDGTQVYSNTGVQLTVPANSKIRLVYTAAPSWAWWRQ